MRGLLIAATTAVASSSFLAPASVFHAPAPRAAVRMAAGSTYAEYTKGNSKDAGNKKPAAVQPPPANEDFLLAAKEAAAGAGITQSPSEIVIAFNSWKMSLGRTYSNAEEEASDLRSFATNADMITQHLTATRDAVATSTPAAEAVSVEFEGVDWRGVYNAASMARNATEAEKATAAAGGWLPTTSCGRRRRPRAKRSRRHTRWRRRAAPPSADQPSPLLSTPPSLLCRSYPILSHPLPSVTTVV